MSSVSASALALEFRALYNTGQTLPVVAELMNVTRYAHAAAVALICYDTLLTFKDEVQYIWPMKLSIIKMFIYGNRLLSFFFILIHAGPMVGLDRSFTSKYCEGIVIAAGFGATVSFAMANWILLARTMALLGQKRSYNTLLVLYFFASHGTTLVLVTLSSIPLISNTFYSSLVHVCAIVFRSKIMGSAWICPMMFETTVFILTIAKLYQNASAASALLGSRLLVVLYRDGVCHYLLIICLRTWNLVCWMILPFSYMFTGYFVLWAVMAIAVTRLQVNLIKATKMNYGTEEESELQETAFFQRTSVLGTTNRAGVTVESRPDF